jgi:predicted dienelactone hydrolase
MAGRVGVRLLTKTPPERGQAVDITLWYPAASGGMPVMVGDNKVFEGVPARKDAPLADGTFPVILVSHGGLRAARNQGAWIASTLAGLGFIVAQTHPPDLGAGGASNAPREIELRPADLSATLTALERNPDLAGHIKPDRAGALGFYLGGTSVLALAGARLDLQLYRQSCDKGGAGPDCAWFARSGVDLHRVDLWQPPISLLDRRIKLVVAVDPELGGSLAPDSLRDIAIPVELINLGGAGTVTPWLDAAILQDAIPTAHYQRLPGIAEFSAFSLCKPQGAQILLESGEDDAICRDGPGETRQTIHTRLAQMIATMFRHHLQGN